MTVNSLLSILLDFQTPRQIYFSKCLIHTYIYVLTHFSRVQLFVTLWTVACQASLSLGFSRQEYWSGLPFPPPEDLPNPGTEPGSPALQADSLPTEPPGKPPNQFIFLQEVPSGSTSTLLVEGETDQEVSVLLSTRVTIWVAAAPSHWDLWETAVHL